MLIYNFCNVFLGVLKLKFNKSLIFLFILNLFYFSVCLAQGEIPDNNMLDSEHSRVNTPHELPPEPTKQPEHIQEPDRRQNENEPEIPPALHEEKKTEKENITRILKNREKKRKENTEQTEPKKTKKIEEPKEKNVNTEEKEKKESEIPSTSNYLPEAPNQEPDDFSSNIPSRENSKKKEYVIKGIISMLLVIAGAILLVIVIITGVNSTKAGKKPKRAKRGKNFFNKKGE